MDSGIRWIRSGAPLLRSKLVLLGRAALVAATLAAVIGLGAVANAPGAQAESPQAESKPTPAKPAEEKKTHDVYLEQVDRLRRDERTGDVTVVGNPAILKHEDGTFTAHKIAFNEKTKLGTATGSPTFKDPETQVTGDTLEFDFDRRLAVFKGHVTLLAERKKTSEKPADQKDDDDDTKTIEEYAAKPTTITCDRLEYYYREKRAVAAGNVKAVQEGGAAEAEGATFLVDEELLVVAGNVRMRTDEGETFRCDKITISLKEKWLEAEGQVASHFKVTEEEEEEEEAEQEEKE